MATNYSLSDSLTRIDKLLKGYKLAPEDVQSDVKVFKYPVATTNRFSIMVAKIDFNLTGGDDNKSAGAFSSVYHELYEIPASWSQCKGISIIGDYMVAVFETPMKSDVDDVIDVAANLCGIVDIINYKCKLSENSKIDIRIGISYGMITLLSYGNKRCSVIVGDEMVNATKSFFEKASEKVIISTIIHANIKDEYKEFFKEVGIIGGLYSGNIINTGMATWLERQKKG